MPLKKRPKGRAGRGHRPDELNPRVTTPPPLGGGVVTVYYKTVCSDECARWLYTTERIVEKVQEMLSGLRMELSRRSP